MVKYSLLEDIHEIQEGFAHLFFFCRGLNLYYYPYQFTHSVHAYFVCGTWQLVDKSRQTLRNQDSYFINMKQDLLEWALDMIDLCQWIHWCLSCCYGLSTDFSYPMHCIMTTQIPHCFVQDDSLSKYVTVQMLCSYEVFWTHLQWSIQQEWKLYKFVKSFLQLLHASPWLYRLCVMCGR